MVWGADEEESVTVWDWLAIPGAVVFLWALWQVVLLIFLPVRVAAEIISWGFLRR